MQARMKGQAAGGAYLMAGVGAITLFIIILTIANVQNSIVLPTLTYQVNNETVNFAAYNTSYAFANTNATVQSVQNTSLVHNLGNFTYNSTHISMLNTTGMANYTLGNKFVSYSYVALERGASNTMTTAQNNTWNALNLQAIGLIVMAAVSILGMFYIGTRKK